MSDLLEIMQTILGELLQPQKQELFPGKEFEPLFYIHGVHSHVYTRLKKQNTRHKHMLSAIHNINKHKSGEIMHCRSCHKDEKTQMLGYFTVNLTGFGVCNQQGTGVSV